MISPEDFVLPAGFKARRAVAMDVNFLVKLHHEAMRESVIATIGEYNTEIQRKRLEKYFDPATLFVISYFGLPVATVDVEPQRDHLYISSFAILPGHQGKNLGRAIMESIAAVGRRIGKQGILLAVLRNSKAVNFYKHLGFIKVDFSDAFNDFYVVAPDVLARQLT